MFESTSPRRWMGTDHASGASWSFGLPRDGNVTKKMKKGHSPFDISHDLTSPRNAHRSESTKKCALSNQNAQQMVTFLAQKRTKGSQTSPKLPENIHPATIHLGPFESSTNSSSCGTELCSRIGGGVISCAASEHGGCFKWWRVARGRDRGLHSERCGGRGSNPRPLWAAMEPCTWQCYMVTGETVKHKHD